MGYKLREGLFRIKSDRLIRCVLNLNEFSDYVNRCNNLENRSLDDNVYTSSLKLKSVNSRNKSKTVGISMRRSGLKLKCLEIRSSIVQNSISLRDKANDYMNGEMYDDK